MTITAAQIRSHRAVLIRYRAGIGYYYALAHIAEDEAAMLDYAFEFQRLTANIDTLARWLEELRLSEQGAMAVREVQRILNHHL